jgi:carbohydrate-selective porin OprB
LDNKKILAVAAAACLAALDLHAAEPSDSEPIQKKEPYADSEKEMQLIDELGRTVSTPLSKVAPGFQAQTVLGRRYQTPSTKRGVRVPDKTLEKLDSIWQTLPSNVEFFPAAPPRLQPYLYNLDQQGNTAAAPGALFGAFPGIEPEVQQRKYWLSSYGLRYSVAQTLTYASMGDVVKGDDSLAKYNFNLPLKWTVFDARGAGTAGWLSAQVQFQSALGGSPSQETVKTNLSTLTNPTGFWSTHSSFRIPELAWQQSFFSGRLVALAGVINQANYLDGNAYANNGRGQFVNSALTNSMVLPLPAYNYALNLQWQPSSDWYTLLGYSVGNAGAGESPGTNFSWSNWSLEWEIGYAPSDFFGMGPGVYRIQPYVGRAGGAVQEDSPGAAGPSGQSVGVGLGINMEQQLGADSPLGLFGRFGFTNSQISAGAKQQIGAGLVMLAPLSYAGWVPTLTNDLLGLGFVWSEPSATTKTIYHDNEHVLEAFYALQLTAMTRLQPDLQIIWDPAFSREAGPITVFQCQFLLKW